MSISCERRIDYLQCDCQSKGITVTPAGRKLMKDDYVKALRHWWIVKKYKSEDNIPWHLRFMLSIESLQLCKRIKDLKIEQQRLIWESDDWIAEPKIDGCRCVIIWNSSEKKFHFYSRNNSAVDYLPQDYSDTILVTCKNFDYPENFVLDAEVISSNPTVATNTQCLTQLQSTAALLNLNAADSKKIQKNNPLKFIVFDCMYNGSSCIDKLWIERHSYAEKLVNVLKESGFNCELNRVVRNTKDNKYAKKEFYDKYVAQGGEGCVLKNINAKYHATSSRTIDCVKVKRSTADNEASDIDAFITDYVVGNDNTRNENTIVGFVFSVKLEKDDGTIVTHPIAVCSNFSDFIKEDATKYNSDGSVTLNPEYYGRVATVKGQNISARNLRLTHAVLEQWRPEKSSAECELLKESFLKSLVF